MRILTNEEMHRVDEETIDRICPCLELMERAFRIAPDHAYAALVPPQLMERLAAAGYHAISAYAAVRALYQEGRARAGRPSVAP